MMEEKRKMRKYFLTIIVALCIGVPSGRSQWWGSVTVGGAVPAGATDNAPVLSTSFTAGIRAMYSPKTWPGIVVVMLDGVHWLKSESPDREAAPMDESLYVNRSLHFPFTAGLLMPVWGMGDDWDIVVYGAVGGYWRNITCRRMVAPGVMDEMEEHGWGFAWKVGFDIVYDGRFSLGMSYLALGNPFTSGGAPLPAGTGAIENGVRYSQPTLEGYGQGFLSLTLGYWIR